MMKFRIRNIIICLIIIFTFIVNLSACSNKVPDTVDNTQLSMSDETYNELCNGVGDFAISTPDLVFADDEKVVLHLDRGIFVYNYKNKEMEKCFNLSSLNCHTNMQGSYGLWVYVSEDGKIALLVSYDIDGSTKDNYYLNLEDGSYEVTKDTEMENYFDNFVRDEDGLMIDRIAIVGNKRISCVGHKTKVIPMGKHRLVIEEAGEKTEIYLFK